ncbi:MAG: adenylate/guanylate cyclase domain-containing protein [Geminicoccaceae bacterium]
MIALPIILPDGVVTLLFADIEGSTLLLQELGDAYAGVLGLYRAVLRDAVDRHDGVEVDTSGDGYFASFPDAGNALEAAFECQAALARGEWPRAVTVRARIGLHTGSVRVVDRTYLGLDVHRAARIAAAGHGGQIVLSKETLDACGQERFTGRFEFRDLGAHRLKDLRYPELLFDAVTSGSNPRFAPLRTVDSRPTNLPQPATALIGRTDELDDIIDLLGRGSVRLLTLTGPGGTGKTRLALEVAGSLIDRFPAGVLHVPLAGIEDAELVVPAIAQTLNIREHGETDLLAAIVNRLQRAKMLLFLDNFEQVMGAVGAIVELLENCPELQLLVTSRETLGSSFERVYPIEPLPLPTGRRANSFIMLAESPAVQLFVERVRDHDPGFELDAANATEIGEICRRLDGLPLAIELAASRLRLLSPAALLGRLSHRLDILKGGRDKNARHRTLRATIDWSYRLLDEDEQRLLQAVAVCAGGFSFQTAEAICEDLDWIDVDILDGITSLAGKSLLALSMVSGERRLRLLDTIREFAFEKLEEGGHLVEMQDRHARHFVGLAEAVAPALLSAEQRAKVGQLLDEQDNLRAALAWALQRSDAELSSRGISALLWFWISRGLFTEGGSWVAKALEHAEQVGSPGHRAAIIDAAGWLRMFTGDYAGALEHCRMAHDLFAELGTPADIARTKMTLGITLAVTGDETNGPPLIFEALEMFRAQGDDEGTVLALIALGEGLRAGGDNETAEHLYNEALEKLQAQGNVYWPGQLLQNLGHMRLAAGDPAAAHDFFSQALEYGRAYDYPIVTNLCLAGFGGVALAHGKVEVAAKLLGKTQHRLEEMGAHFEPMDHAAFERYVADATARLGNAAYAAAALEGRKWTLEEAFEAGRALGEQDR